MQAKLVERLPVGEHWRYELKLERYRVEAIKTAKSVKLISRNRKDLTGEYPEIVQAVMRLDVKQGVLDGEIVAVGDDGKPSFQSLQHLPTPGRGSRPILYFAFDALNLEGIVAKLDNSRYEPAKRTGAWVKWKCGFSLEFVIGGYTRGSGGRSAFGALIVGYYAHRHLRYASKVGAGFSNAQIREIITTAEPLPTNHTPV